MEFWRIYQIFPKLLGPPINSAQIQNQFVSWNFNSNCVWNLNLPPNGNLFTIFEITLMQCLVNFGALKGMNL
jgi:hypothetical protein